MSGPFQTADKNIGNPSKHTPGGDSGPREIRPIRGAVNFLKQVLPIPTSADTVSGSSGGQRSILANSPSFVADGLEETVRDYRENSSDWWNSEAQPGQRPEVTNFLPAFYDPSKDSVDTLRRKPLTSESLEEQRKSAPSIRRFFYSVYKRDIEDLDDLLDPYRDADLLNRMGTTQGDPFEELAGDINRSFISWVSHYEGLQDLPYEIQRQHFASKYLNSRRNLTNRELFIEIRKGLYQMDWDERFPFFKYDKDGIFTVSDRWQLAKAVQFRDEVPGPIFIEGEHTPISTEPITIDHEYIKKHRRLAEEATAKNDQKAQAEEFARLSLVQSLALEAFHYGQISDIELNRIFKELGFEKTGHEAYFDLVDYQESVQAFQREVYDLARAQKGAAERVDWLGLVEKASMLSLPGMLYQGYRQIKEYRKPESPEDFFYETVRQQEAAIKARVEELLVDLGPQILELAERHDLEPYRLASLIEMSVESGYRARDVGVMEMLTDLVNHPEKRLPFVGVLFQSYEFAPVAYIKYKADHGEELSEEDISVLNHFVIEVNRNKTFWGEVFGIIEELPAQAVEFAVTSGIYSSAKAGVKAGIKASLKSIIKWAATGSAEDVLKKAQVKKLIKSRVSRWTGTAITEGIAVTSHATVSGGGGILGGTLTNHLLPDFGAVGEYESLEDWVRAPAEPLPEAFLKAFTDNLVEVASEYAGDGLQSLGKKIFSKLAVEDQQTLLRAAVINGFLRLNDRSALPALDALVRKAGWNAVYMEMVEEELAREAQGVLYEATRGYLGTEYRLPTLRELGVELTAFGIPAGVKNVVGGVASMSKETREKALLQNFRQAVERFQEAFGSFDAQFEGEVRRALFGEDGSDGLRETANENSGNVTETPRDFLPKAIAELQSAAVRLGIKVEIDTGSFTGNPSQSATLAPEASGAGTGSAGRFAHTAFDAEGNITIYLPRNFAELIRQEAGSENNAAINQRAADVLDEELKHVAGLKYLKEEWEKAGGIEKAGPFDEYVKAKVHETLEEVSTYLGTGEKGSVSKLSRNDAIAARNALLHSVALTYAGDARLGMPAEMRATLDQILKTATGDAPSRNDLGTAYQDLMKFLRSDQAREHGVQQTVIFEYVRQLAQLRERNQISETGYRSLITILREWVDRALKGLKMMAGENSTDPDAGPSGFVETGKLGSHLQELYKQTLALREKIDFILAPAQVTREQAAAAEEVHAYTKLAFEALNGKKEGAFPQVELGRDGESVTVFEENGNSHTVRDKAQAEALVREWAEKQGISPEAVSDALPIESAMETGVEAEGPPVPSARIDSKAGTLTLTPHGGGTARTFAGNDLNGAATAWFDQLPADANQAKPTFGAATDGGYLTATLPGSQETVRLETFEDLQAFAQSWQQEVQSQTSGTANATALGSDSSGPFDSNSFFDTHQTELAPVLTKPAIRDAAERGIQRLGQPFAEALLRISTAPDPGGGRIGSAYTAQRFVSTVNEFSADAIASLSQSQSLDKALGGLTELLKLKDIEPGSIIQAINNPNVFGHRYKPANLLTDAGRLARLNVKGLDKALGNLKSTKQDVSVVKGFRYEIAGGATLSRRGYPVVEVSRGIVVEWTLKDRKKFGERTEGKTDIDVIAEKGNKVIYFQLKSSANGLGNPVEVEAWLVKAKRDLERKGRGESEIIFVLPNGRKGLSPEVDILFKKHDPPIKVIQIPHLD